MREEERRKTGEPHLIEPRALRMARLLFVALVIVVTSWLVYSVNVRTLEHARNFTRTMHYHVLNHQTIGVYWFGQEMLNYPIH